MNQTDIKVVTIEDDDRFRAHLEALIGGAPGFCCVGSYNTAESGLNGLAIDRPDVLLLDLELPKTQGTELISEVAVRWPKLAVLVLTIHDDPKVIFQALENGAVGHLIKPVPPARLLEAIAEAHAGGSPMSSSIARLVVRRFQERGRSRRQLESLTPREAEVLDHVTRGLETKEIAAALSSAAVVSLLCHTAGPLAS
jgi:DNA-binding NarL/FixJ family response regulator